MRNAEIERLLGGYATNTLTDSERQTLYEAALEDQELFNALQDEQALRDLLGDPGSRLVIERALKQPALEPRQRRFSPLWALGLAASVALAAVLVFALLQSRPAPIPAQVAIVKGSSPIEIPPAKPQAGTSAPVPSGAASHVAPKQLERRSPAPVQEVRRQEETPGAGTASAIDRAPENSRLAQVQATNRPTDLQFVPPAAASANPPAPVAFRADAASGNVSASAGAGVIPYSVLRRGPDGSFTPIVSGEELRQGDAVRLQLHPPVSGFLILQEQSAGGNWNRIFPASGAGLPVTANQDVAIPDLAIQVNGAQQLRLMLVAGQPASLELQSGAKSALHQPRRRLDQQTTVQQQSGVTQSAPRPLITNITLAPGKAQ